MADRFWSVDECGWVGGDALATPWSDRRMDPPDLPTVTGYPDVLGYGPVAPAIPAPRGNHHDAVPTDTDTTVYDRA